MLLPRFPPAAPLPDAPSRPGFFSAALVSAPFPPPAPTKHVPAVAAALFPAPGPLALNGGPGPPPACPRAASPVLLASAYTPEQGFSTKAVAPTPGPFGNTWRHFW